MKKLLLVSLSILLLCVTQVFAQNRTITGTVTAKSDGTPLPGVTVAATGTTIGTQTDASGKYTLSVPASAKTLSFSFIGYATLQVPVSGGTANAALVSSTNALTEVVVIGYGTSTKEAFTGSAKTISADQIDKKRVDNITQALAGEVSGVRAVNPSGQPGAVATIRIRGFGSIIGDRSPLYVLDGVPYSGSLNAINPGDIETTTVLKDAAATAIYGVRGANGVVLLTTKSGKNKANYIEGEVNVGVNKNYIPRYSVITSPEQYVGLSWEGLYNQGLGLATPTADPVTYANTRLYSTAGLPVAYNIWNSTGANLIDPATRTVRAGVTRKYDPENWKYYAFQSSGRIDANVRLGGGTDKYGYFMSLGYVDDKGYSIASDYKRLTGRLNLNSQIKPWLNAVMNVNYAYSKQNVGGNTGDSGSIFWFVDNIPPIYGLFLRDANGNIVQDPIFGGNQYNYGADGRKFASLTNSIADTKYNTNRNDRNEINGNVQLNATIIKGLTFENNFGMQYYQLNNVQRNNKFYGSAASQGGSIFLNNTDLTSLTLTDLLRYTKTIGDNNFSILAAHEATKFTTGNLQAFKTGLVRNDVETLDNAIVSTPSSSSIDTYRLESYFASATYDYKQKYFLSGTVRRDASSRFVNNKWGNFGSVGAAWLMSSENFMQSQKIFSSFKVKASYGVNGSQAATAYYPGLTVSAVSPSNGLPSFSAPTVGNPDLTWEQSKIGQGGVEFNVGKFLTAELVYYVKNTTNQLFDRRVGISNGFATLRVNDGAVRNQGFEFDVTAHILKSKNYYFDFNVNGEFLKNKITAMAIDPSTGQQQVLNPSGNYGYSVGHSLFDFYTKQYAGVNPANGNSTWGTYWVDLDGDGKPKTGTIEAGTGEYIASLAAFPAYVASHQNVAGINKGINQTTTETYSNASLQYTGQSAIPTVRGAFNLSGGYHGFDLSVQILYSLGGYAYDGAYANLMADGLVGSNNWSTDILRRWQKPGDITDVPRLSNAQNTNVASSSTRFITSANYLSFNNVRLAYNFTPQLLKKIGVAGLNLSLTGDNLYYFSKRKGFNPAAGNSTTGAGTTDDGASSIYSYAPLSTISVGIKAKF